MIGHEIVRTTDKGLGIDAPVPPTIRSGQPARDMRRIASFFLSGAWSYRSIVECAAIAVW